MNRLTIAAQTIKESVSALEVGQILGLEIRHGRCKCPIHGGGDYNCVLYPGHRGYYCHVCKSGGDVIKFVQEYHGTSFRNAVVMLNDAFHLGLDIDSPMSQEAVKRAENARKKRKAEREFQEWKKRMSFDMALTADQIVRWLELVRDANVPKAADEEWNASFRMAVELLPEARRFAEDCAMMCIEEKKD